MPRKQPQISISVTPEERDALHQAARDRGHKSTSAFVREIVFAYIGITDTLTPWGHGRSQQPPPEDQDSG